MGHKYCFAGHMCGWMLHNGHKPNMIIFALIDL